MAAELGVLHGYVGERTPVRQQRILHPILAPLLRASVEVRLQRMGPRQFRLRVDGEDQVYADAATLSEVPAKMWYG